MVASPFFTNPQFAQGLSSLVSSFSPAKTASSELTAWRARQAADLVRGRSKVADLFSKINQGNVNDAVHRRAMLQQALVAGARHGLKPQQFMNPYILSLMANTGGKEGAIIPAWVGSGKRVSKGSIFTPEGYAAKTGGRGGGRAGVASMFSGTGKPASAAARGVPGASEAKGDKPLTLAQEWEGIKEKVKTAPPEIRIAFNAALKSSRNPNRGIKAATAVWQRYQAGLAKAEAAKTKETEKKQTAAERAREIGMRRDDEKRTKISKTDREAARGYLAAKIKGKGSSKVGVGVENTFMRRFNRYYSSSWSKTKNDRDASMARAWADVGGGVKNDSGTARVFRSPPKTHLKGQSRYQRKYGKPQDTSTGAAAAVKKTVNTHGPRKAQPLPKDQSQWKKGTLYISPTGKKGIWTGKTFRTAD